MQTGENDFDEFVQILFPESSLFRQHKPFGGSLDRVDDEHISDDFEQGCLAMRLSA